MVYNFITFYIHFAEMPAINDDWSNIWRQVENNNKDLQDNYIFGAYFGTDSFFIVSLPEKYLSGIFSWTHLDFCDKCNHSLYSFTITNECGLVSCVCTCDAQQVSDFLFLTPGMSGDLPNE